MARVDAKERKCALFTQENLVLVVTQAGSISSVIEAPDSLRADLAAGTEMSSIDQLWSQALADCIRESLKRVLRDRRSHSIEIDNAAASLTSDIIFVPQGRDRVLVIVRDVSEQKQALARARQLAYTDDVTELPNRDFMFSALQKITDLQRLKEGRAAMICIHVGQIDDHGYALNSAQLDELMKQLATRLAKHLRGANDESVTDYERYSVAARTDYRQFSVVLPSIESGEDAEAVVDRLVTDLRQPISVGARTVVVRACGGVALFPQDGTDPAALFENALGAMEDARNDPTATFKFHSGTVRLRTLQRKDLEVELRSVLDREECALNFLPVIDANTGAPVIIEALLRWPETILGTQPTRKIVRVAERTGLILPIGRWVLRNACEQLQSWRKAGHDHVRVAINLSAQELVSDGITERIEKILVETETNPCDVDLEIKEHMLLRESLSDYATCKELQALGVRIVIDDFGIGACSLAHLSQSPIGAIKIDNTLVANVTSNSRDKAACSAVIAIANELDIGVIAEGVETELQAKMLREKGCRYLQGFLFGTPMSDVEMLRFLDDATQGVAKAKGLR